MFPFSLSLNQLDHVLAICHKETQTSSASLKDSFTTTATANYDTDKGSLKIFEYSEVVQDPNHPRDITIIKDVFAEEIHDHSSPSGSVTEDANAVANRYRYCREVIKPYLKDYPKDCPISDEQLIRDALDAAHEDFPDYEPCFENNDGDPVNPDKIDSPLGTPLPSSPFSTPKDSSLGTPKTLLNDSTSSDCEKGKHVKPVISKSNLSRISTVTNLKSNMDQQKENCPEKEKPKGCPTKSKKPGCPPPIEICKDEALWPPAGPPSACQAKTLGGSSKCKDRVPSAGACNDVPNATPKKERSCEQDRSDMDDLKQKYGIECDSTLTPPKKKTMMEAHTEAVTTIKTAVEDFIGKFYQTTKDAVAIVKTESAKQLGRMTAKKSASNTDIIPQAVNKNKSSETITSFNYFRSTDNPDAKSQSTDSEEVDENLIRAGQVIGKIFAKVDSTVSMLSENIDLQKVKSLITFEDMTNRNYPFDKVQSNEEEPVSTSVPSSVFSAIKTRIVSMFSDVESGVKENVSEKSNVSAESSNASIISDDSAKKKNKR